MYLLQTAAENLNTFAAWGQFLAAGITVFLLIRSTIQDSQIKKLTELIGKLNKANEINEERLEIERIASIKSRMPVFVIDYSHDHPDDMQVDIGLINVGLPFQYFETMNSSSNIYMFKNQGSEGSSTQPRIVRPVFNAGELLDDYEFEIVSTSEHGIKYSQKLVKRYAERPILLPPTEYSGN